MTVGYIQENMTSREFAEWMVYYKLQAERRTKAELIAKAEAGLQRSKMGR